MDADEVEKLFRRLNRPGRVILVEGKKDETALRDWGVETTILRFGSGPAALARRAAALSSDPVLLFDFDDEGERKTREMEGLLAAENAFADRGLRRQFRRVFKVRTVEALPLALQRISSKVKT